MSDTAVGVARVHLRTRVLDLGAEISDLTSEQARLLDRKRRLEAERAYLRHPDQIQEVATERLHMVPVAAERVQKIRLIEIKLSQGAKPGKGGILPGAKVTEEIAAIRGIPVGKDSISPNRYPEINSVPELIDFVERVRSVTGKPTGIKMVIGSWGWLDELFEEINRRGIEHAPDFVTVDSGEGGTGATPMSLIDCVGLPIQESLPMVANKLVEHGLRERIKVFSWTGSFHSILGMTWLNCGWKTTLAPSSASARVVSGNRKASKQITTPMGMSLKVNIVGPGPAV